MIKLTAADCIEDELYIGSTELILAATPESKAVELVAAGSVEDELPETAVLVKPPTTDCLEDALSIGNIELLLVAAPELELIVLSDVNNEVDALAAKTSDVLANN